MMWDWIQLRIAFDTPQQKIDALETIYRQILLKHPEDFAEEQSIFLLGEIADVNKLTVGAGRWTRRGSVYLDSIAICSGPDFLNRRWIYSLRIAQTGSPANMSSVAPSSYVA